MKYWIYVLKSESLGRRYIGSTADVATRLNEHLSGKCRYTKGSKDWKLIYKETFKSRSEAVKQERYLKSGVGRKFLDNLLQ